ncbi:hypothetical protein FNU76_15760 [Chitinimonas arctica]|uniref:Phage abortive infection protein n=1 Tax=Chitinimonas arctica TaxID=2594795 RepID=A0A516SI18_9NEIS|nr:putative phage abortive infection protein [Chitinimonas arctica]QDQ27688.1 hypothetical protein FNU76_15760 [Chitinimonas arctica]
MSLREKMARAISASWKFVNKEISSFTLFIFFLFMFSLAWSLAPLIAEWLFSQRLSGSRNLEELGQIGDSYGIFNSLLSGLTLFAAAAAYFSQREQINTAVKERHSDEVQQQKDNAAATFFHLLSLHREIKVSLDVNENMTGGKFFRYVSIAKKDVHARNQDFEESLIDSFKFMLATQEGLKLHFVTYFSSLKLILEHINSSEAWNSTEKSFFAKIVKAQFLPEELPALILHTAANDRFGLKVLIEKYALLENYERTPTDLWLDVFLSEFDRSAAGANDEILF